MKKTFLAVLLIANTVTAYSSTLRISKTVNLSDATQDQCNTSNKEIRSWLQFLVEKKIEFGVFAHVTELVDIKTEISNAKLKDSDSVLVTVKDSKALLQLSEKLSFNIDVNGEPLNINLLPKKNKVELSVATVFNENITYDSLGRVVKDDRDTCRLTIDSENLDVTYVNADTAKEI